MTVEFINQTRQRIPRAYLQKWVDHVAKRLGKTHDLKGKELVVAFVSGAKIRKLNKEFRGKDKKTDVLSFAAFEPSSLGELVLCPEVLQRQAKEHNLSFRREAAYMLLHGILHLLGYEHEAGGAKAEKMYRLQDEIFQKIDKIR